MRCYRFWCAADGEDMVRVARGCVYNKAELCKGMQRLDDELKTLKYCGTCNDDGCNGSGALKSSVVAMIFAVMATCLQTFYRLQWETERNKKYNVSPTYNIFTKVYLTLLFVIVLNYCSKNKKRKRFLFLRVYNVV